MLYINVLQQLIEDVYNIKDTHCTDMSDFAYPSGNGFFPGHMCTPFPPDFVGFGLVNLNFFFVVCLLFCHFHYYHCIVCPSIYGFWFHYLPLYCLSFDLRLLISLFTIVLSVLRFTASDFTIYHCIVCPSTYGFLISSPIYGIWFPLLFTTSDSHSIYGFWFPLRFTASDFHFDLLLLISTSIYNFWFPLRFTASDFPFDLRLLISHSIYDFWFPPSIYGFWFPVSSNLSSLHEVVQKPNWPPTKKLQTYH
jgi:hypothetical protein